MPKTLDITFVNEATVEIPFDVAKFIANLEEFHNDVFAPAWGCPQAWLHLDAGVPAGHYGHAITDDADQAGALGYHDLTPDGFPMSHSFAKTTLDAGEDVGVTISHEHFEQVIDPGIQKAAIGPDDTTVYSYEVCDAVEETVIPFKPGVIGPGNVVSNFVLPTWFEGFHKPTVDSGVTFDQLGICTKPFELLPGGYIPAFVRGRWVQLTPPKPKKPGGHKPKTNRHRRLSRKLLGLHDRVAGLIEGLNLEYPQLSQHWLHG